jgi:cytochrome c oxidase subunit 2
MKLIGWAIALSAAVMTPAAALAQEPSRAADINAVQSAGQPVGQAVGQAVAQDRPQGAVPTPTTQAFPKTAPTPGIGYPDGRAGLQDQVTVIGQRAAAFHNGPLLLMCLLISMFVLILLGYTMFKYRRSANPTPSRSSHNTVLEVVWTLVPVLVLVAIAIPSIRLIAAQYSPPPADLTIKVVGHQWYWTYQYPDNGGFEIVSNMLKEQGDVKAGERFRSDADGPPLLAVDERLVIPAGKVVKFLITSEDVIHSFAVPSFWTKMDANPGRINQDWVKVDRPGVYFGQCSELCGARHAYMPIAVEVLPEAQFNAWLASKGGTPKQSGKRVPVSQETVRPGPNATPQAPASAPDPAAIPQPTLNQSVPAQN